MRLALLLAGASILTAPAAARQPPRVARSSATSAHVWRVRKPLRAIGVWTIAMIEPVDILPTGKPIKNLTRAAYRLSLRPEPAPDGNPKYRYTLPQRGSRHITGHIDLCADLICEGDKQIEFFPKPRYSQDGTQCLLGRITTLADRNVRYHALNLATENNLTTDKQSPH